jgi:hypothetical protein
MIIFERLYRESAMRRIIVLSLCLLATCLSYAQTDLKSFLDSVNWSQRELEFTSQFKGMIEPRPHASSTDGTTSDFIVTGLRMGETDVEAAVYVDSLSRQLSHLFISIYFGELKDKSEAVTLSKKMDAALTPLFGKPDEIENELDNAYVNRLGRKWYCENYTIEVTHLIITDSQFYSISIKGLDNSSPDFRVARWGESKEVIMAKEGKTDLSPDEDLYMFTDNVAGFSCMVGYFFVDNKLVRSRYLFQQKHTNKNDYIYDFKDLVELMSQKYGKPDWNSPEWKNRLYQDDPSEYGFAVSLGHLVYSAGWLTDKTDISVLLTGENYDISFLVQYSSTKYKQLREENQKKRSLDLL